MATATAVALLIDAARTPGYLARGAEALVGLAAPIAVATVGCRRRHDSRERLFFRIPARSRYRTLVGASWASRWAYGFSVFNGLATSFKPREPNRFARFARPGAIR